MIKFLTLTMSLLLLSLVLPQFSAAQSVKRQSIGSYGSNGFTGGAVIGQTIGQPFATTTYSDSEVSLAPGFQQPLTYKKAETVVDMKIMNVNVFPNPTITNFVIEPQEILEDVKLTIRDVNGRLFIEKQLVELSNYTVNCSGWQAGIYFISLSATSTNINYYLKIIITK